MLIPGFLLGNKMAKQKMLHNQLSFMAAIDSTPLDSDIVLQSDPRWSNTLKEFAVAKAFGIDIETQTTKNGNGLDHWRGAIRLIQVYLPKSGLTLILDLQNDKADAFIGLLGRQLANPAVAVVGANLYFDLLWLRTKYGFRACNIRDSQLLSQTLWAGIKSYKHSLAAVYQRLFNKVMAKESQLSNWADPNLSNTQLNYAARDSKNAFMCVAELGKRIQSFNNMPSVLGGQCDYTLQEVALIECNAIPAFVEIAHNGLPVNIPYALDVEKQYADCIENFYAPVKAKVNLPYSAQPIKMVQAVYDIYGVWLLAEDVKYDQDEDTADDDVFLNQKQQTLFELKQYPEVPKGYKLTTSSDVLFQYYCETGEEDLLVLSLVRSLKKSLDAITTLRTSAQQNKGFAKGSYRSLGFTSTGRSTCGGGGHASTLIALNLQNLPNVVEHDLLDKYKLPAPRDVIQAMSGYKLSIIDLSAAHSRIMADLSQDPLLLNSLNMKDPHLLMTASMMNTVQGTSLTADDLISRGGKKDPEIAQFRSLAKTFYYLALNVGSAKRAQAVFQKSFNQVSLEDCKLAAEAFSNTFEGVVSFQRQLHNLAKKVVIELPVELKNGSRFNLKYAMFRTPDGRLIHLECHRKEKKKKSGETYIVYEPKINDCTSCVMISAEALLEKASLTRIMDEVIPLYPDNTTLNGFCHDELNLLVPDDSQGVAFVQKVLAINSGEFQKALHVTPGGMKTGEQAAKDTLADRYSEK
jgi:DNA polymerase I-like protein with 3'-5' exonuclease and polymerase domains